MVCEMTLGVESLSDLHIQWKLDYECVCKVFEGVFTEKKKRKNDEWFTDFTVSKGRRGSTS